MRWDVLYDGFRDEFDFAVLDMEEVEGSLRAQAFSGGRVVPVILMEDGRDDYPEHLLELLGFTEESGREPKGRLVTIAAPTFDYPTDVEFLDESGEWGHIHGLGWGRCTLPPEERNKTYVSGEDTIDPETGESTDLSYVIREFVIHTLRMQPCFVWDRGVFDAGDHYVVKFRVSLQTPDEKTARKLAREKLMVRTLNAWTQTTEWPIDYLEDVTYQREEGVWTRTLSLSVQIPRDTPTLCLWVWSQTLNSGGFRAFTHWYIESLSEETRATMTAVDHDPAYDAWVRARQAEAAAEPDAAGAAGGSEGAAAPHLHVLVIEEPEIPLAGTRQNAASPWGWVPGLRQMLDAQARSAARAHTLASLGVQTHRNFDVRFVAGGEPLGAGAPDGTPDGGDDWTVVIGLGDRLEPDALEALLRETADPGVLMVYGDEDVALEGAGGEIVYAHARLKPTFSQDELYFGNGVGLPLAVAPGVLDPGATSAYELALRALEQGGEGAVRHVEAVLLHAAADRPFATGGMVAPLARHLERRGVAADVVYRETNLATDPAEAPERHPGGVLRVRYGRPDPAPLVSIIIPNRDHADYLGPCVESILELTRWPSYEIVIVENGSVEPATTELYRELQERDERVRVVGWRGEGFNYPAIVNRGVAKSSGELLCLLNNDTVVLDGDWLDELAGPLTRPEVGITGALLSFEDGLVQHAGMMAVPDGGFAHQQQNLWPGTLEHGDADGDEGYLMTLQRPVAYSMVTGACQMIRRSVYEELGGYDEALAVGYNDGDFCLRAAKAGYRTLFTPYARLQHREFGTRRRETRDSDNRERWLSERRLMMERHPEVFGRDPFLNRALDPDSRYFSLKRARWAFETDEWLGWPIIVVPDDDDGDDEIAEAEVVGDGKAAGAR